MDSREASAPLAPAEVLFIDQVAQRLHMTERTIYRLLRTHAFPIAELPRLDHRRRWSSRAVDEWIATAHRASATGRPQLVRSGR